MSSNTSWPATGADHDGRVFVDDLPRRSSLPIGQWLGRLVATEVAENPKPLVAQAPLMTSEPEMATEPVMAALQALANRFAASERDHAARTARFEAAVARLHADQAHMLRRLEAAERGGGRMETLRAMEQVLEQLASQWRGGGGQAMEILREDLRTEIRRAAKEADRRIHLLEQRQAEAVAELGFEITRSAQSMEERLRRSERTRAEAWAKLAEEIARLSERVQSPKSAAPAGPDASELTDRIRQSEGRMALLLAEARATAAANAAPAPAPPPPAPPTPQRPPPPLAETLEPFEITPLPSSRWVKRKKPPVLRITAALAACVAAGAGAYAIWITQTTPETTLPPTPAPAAVKPAPKPAPAPAATNPVNATPIPASPAAATPVAATPAAAAPPKAADTQPAALFVEGARRLDAGDSTGLAPLRQSAELGYPPAEGRLGRLYATGGAGLVQDSLLARIWSRKGAEGGDPDSMYDLALDYAHGVGGPLDAVESVRWLRRCAQRGQRDGQRSLAHALETGVGASQDLASAYQWYLIAAHGGDHEASTRADGLKGRLTASDRKRAEAAAAAFHPDAAAIVVTASPA